MTKKFKLLSLIATLNLVACQANQNLNVPVLTRETNTEFMEIPSITDFSVKNLTGKALSGTTQGRNLGNHLYTKFTGFQDLATYEIRTTGKNVKIEMRKSKNGREFFDRYLNGGETVRFVYNSQEFNFDTLRLGNATSNTATSYSISVVKTAEPPKLRDVPAINQRTQSGYLGKSGTSIAGYGCALVSVTALIQFRGMNISVQELNKRLGANGYDGDAIRWSSAAVATGMRYREVSSNQLDGELSKGNPVIVRLTKYLNSKYPHHFVVVSRKNGNGTYRIMDPWGGVHKDVNIWSYAPSFRGTYTR